MQVISDEESFKTCWIKTILNYVLTKKELIFIANQFRLITNHDSKISKSKLIKVINSGSEVDSLIKELDAVLTRRGISTHLYSHLKSLYTKIEIFEPNKLANIYLHLAEGDGIGDMAKQIFNGEDLKKVFRHEIIIRIFYEVLIKAENKSLMIFEHIVNRSISTDK